MDRKNYDQRMITLFDIIGSYFINVFYNVLYASARNKVNSGLSKSITDAYRSNVVSYMSAVSERGDLYKKVIMELHEYYSKSSGFSTINFPDFENKFLSNMIPAEYYKDFTSVHKERIMNEIIKTIVNSLGELMIGRQFLAKIIDDHTNRANITPLQDQAIEFLINQRDSYYEKFAREINKQNTGGKINRRTVENLKKAFTDQLQKNAILEADADRAANIIRGLLQDSKTKEGVIESYETKIKKYEQEIASLRKQITSAINDMNALTNARANMNTNTNVNTNMHAITNERKTDLPVKSNAPTLQASGFVPLKPFVRKIVPDEPIADVEPINESPANEQPEDNINQSETDSEDNSANMLIEPVKSSAQDYSLDDPW